MIGAETGAAVTCGAQSTFNRYMNSFYNIYDTISLPTAYIWFMWCGRCIYEGLTMCS